MLLNQRSERNTGSACTNRLGSEPGRPDSSPALHSCENHGSTAVRPWLFSILRAVVHANHDCGDQRDQNGGTDRHEMAVASDHIDAPRPARPSQSNAGGRQSRLSILRPLHSGYCLPRLNEERHKTKQLRTILAHDHVSEIINLVWKFPGRSHFSKAATILTVAWHVAATHPGPATIGIRQRRLKRKVGQESGRHG